MDIWTEESKKEFLDLISTPEFNSIWDKKCGNRPYPKLACESRKFLFLHLNPWLHSTACILGI